MKGKYLISGLVLFTCLLLATTTALAQDNYCEGNFDYDDNVDGGDVIILKQHFGRGGYNNPCPPDGPSPVAKTGVPRLAARSIP